MPDEEKEKDNKEAEVITYNLQPHDSTLDVIWEIKYTQDKDKKTEGGS